MKKFLIVLTSLLFIVCLMSTSYAGPSLTDEQKLEAAKRAFIEKLDSIDDWATFKSLLQNISPTMVKNFLKNKIEEKEQAYIDASTQLATTSADLGDLVDEIDAIP